MLLSRSLFDMDALLVIGERNGIPVIEDSAQAIGSVLHDTRASSMGRFGIFSFNDTTTMNSGEIGGGMFVTNEQDLYKKVFCDLKPRSRSQPD